MYLPINPLSFPKPFGKRLDLEFNKIRLVFSVAAVINITLAK